tara:strand:+ start:108 stop:257 length:150 start_codon:yes stop_codon:yes gene_type:complete
MREIKKQVAYKIKPSLYSKIKEQADREDKTTNQFMQDVHFEYLKRKKAL